MNYDSPFLIKTLLLLCLLRIARIEFAEENIGIASLMSLKKLEKSKTEALKFYDLSKPFSKENEVFEIQEARRKRIETFCSEKRSDDFLPQDSLRFTKIGVFFCTLQDDKWLNTCSFRLSQKMPKFESIYEFTTKDVQNPPAYIMTEDPIKRFLRYYHANARSSTYSEALRIVINIFL